MDYQKEYINKNPDLHNSDLQSKVDAIKQAVGSKKQFDSVIDVACGSGNILLNISSHFRSKKLLGVDISRDIIAIAKSNDSKKKATWLVSDVFDLKPDKYELVLAIDILEHVDNDLAFLKQIKNLGNFIVIKTPIERNFINRFVRIITLGIIDEYRHTKIQYGHIHHYSVKDVLDLIDNAGLKIVNKVYLPLPRRSKLFWEIIRIAASPLWRISVSSYLRVNGGFLVLLLTRIET